MKMMGAHEVKYVLMESYAAIGNERLEHVSSLVTKTFLNS